MNPVEIDQKSFEMPPREGSASHIFSPSPTSTGRLASTRRSSAVGSSAWAIPSARLATSRSPTRGSSSTSAAARHPTSHR